MQKAKVIDGANADGTVNDDTVYIPASWNDNIGNLFKLVENAGYTLIDDDGTSNSLGLQQVTKAVQGLYNPAFTYNTSSIVTQTVDDIVTGSDGKRYKALDNNVVGDDPVGSITGNWEDYNPNSSGIESGLIVANPSSTVPNGFLECNGAELSRTTYADLFSSIGTAYGVGDGDTTFNIPDLRGEFIRGWDNSRGIDSGRNIGTYQADEFKAHDHAANEVGSIESSGQNTPNGLSGVSGNVGYTLGGVETRPRNIAMMYCIKY